MALNELCYKIYGFILVSILLSSESWLFGGLCLSFIVRFSLLVSVYKNKRRRNSEAHSMICYNHLCWFSDTHDKLEFCVLRYCWSILSLLSFVSVSSYVEVESVMWLKLKSGSYSRVLIVTYCLETRRIMTHTHTHTHTHTQIILRWRKYVTL